MKNMNTQQLIEEFDEVAHGYQEAMSLGFGNNDTEAMAYWAGIDCGKDFMRQALREVVREAEAGKELAEAVERIKLDLDVVVCDCGEPYKGTDPSIATDEALAEYKQNIKKLIE